MNTNSCLERANELINGPRRTDYGPIEKSAVDVARMWSSLLGIEVTPEKYLLCMAAMKLYRQTVRHKIDNLDDACGYIALAENVILSNEAKESPQT